MGEVLVLVATVTLGLLLAVTLLAVGVYVGVRCVLLDIQEMVNGGDTYERAFRALKDDAESDE